MAKGNKKKRMKKYKKKYYTGGRIDMSKGGRVSLQEGGNPKYGDYRINKDGVREQFSPVGWNPTKEQPKPVVKKPIEQEPQKPIQPGIPVTGGGNLGSGKMPRADLPTGPAKAPVNTGRPIQRGGVGSIKQVDSSDNQIIPNVSTGTSQTEQPAKPSLRMEREAMNPATGKQYTPEEKRALDASIDQREFKRSPTTGKGSDQMSIGGIGGGEIQTAMDLSAAQERQAAERERGVKTQDPREQAQEQETWWSNAGYGSPQEALNDGWYFDEMTRQFVPGGTTSGGGQQNQGGQQDPQDPQDIPLTDLTDTQKEAKFQSDRKSRILETAQEAQQMSQGVMPEDIPTIPDPRKIPLDKTEITPEQAAQLQMEATKQAEAAKVAAVSPEQVSIIEDVATAKAPEPFAAAKLGDEDISKVPEDAVVDAASGSVSPEVSDTLAKAAGIERVAPIEAAEVEVLPGALQERVVGTISKEAKAQAAKVAGTSLAKITRAKKQLRNAGLGEDEIAEIGNDPEELEARLTDFTEEQRGIIEGLPEEALVSTQINGLLEGMENGEIPIWARPAVASVEAMLAQRGMSASTVGRDALLNAIITSALPIAQANAQAIQTSVSQQKSIEATAALKDAEMAQQTALFNAQNVFQMDMAQFSADQQRAVNNSKFLQTASLQNATMEQQGVMQDAVLMAQRNLAEADQNTKLGIENAKAFLAMDIQNLNNEQQASILKAQQIQQRLLSNQAAENAALQFNATSENQVNQFMTSIKAQTDQFNATQTNAMAQFNANSENAAEARRAGRDFEASRIDAQLATEIDKFNAAQDFAREQFNVQNETAIAQSNVQWRRQANTADTAAINAVNQQNAQNAFGLTASAMNFLWQEVRDEADFIFKRWDNDQQRKTSLMIAALGNEAGTAKDTSWSTNLSAITQLVNGWLD